MAGQWKTDVLGNVATLQRGFDLPKRLRKPGDVPIVTSSGIEERHSEAKVKAPGVVTGRYGTIGQVFFVEEDFWPLNTTLYVRDFHGNSPLFVASLLRTIDFHMHSGKSGVPGVNRNDLHEISIRFPPTKAEQEAIAEALSDADALIESLEQLLAKKRLIKQGAMQELLTGKRRLPGFGARSGFKPTEIGKIPSDWRLETIGELSEVGRGRVINHKEIGRSVNPIYPVYSSQTSNDGVMGYLDTYSFDGEYITWTTDGANAGTVFYRNGRFNCTNVCGTIKLHSDDHSFVASVLGTIAKRHVSRHLGNPKLMNDVMKSVKIPLPESKAEQQSIAIALSDMDSELTALDAKLTKARAIKQGMMQELLTGRIRLV
ncbi:MAG: restriction endonuclease subunit S [Acetobacteraceae bacterium]|nr:restriction endonuclease subunit S [Acetobacteraceae bacterium]